MNEPFVSIIMRSYNEAWALRGTLEALRGQEYRNWELIVFDSASTDGSVDLIRQANPRHFVQLGPGEYHPPRVLNHGMRLARSNYAIFLNADATPQGRDWLTPLVKNLLNPHVGAVFSRQVPRPDCDAVYACDYERCFGPRRESARWPHFFSMVSSGLRKNIWEQRGFNENMQYSEDDEYTRWCRAAGYKIVYVPRSCVMHSHNYTAEQATRRSYGEGRALAAVWEGSPRDFSFARTVLFGWANDLRRDISFCYRNGKLGELRHAARIRWCWRRARLAGFRDGWRDYRKNGERSIPEFRITNGNLETS